MFIDIVDTVVTEKGRCRVLDVGGTATYWSTFGRSMDWSRVKVTLLNLAHVPMPEADHLEQVVGDATNMSEFDNNSFDVVHSNSVIEHVGLWPSMRAMAKEVRRLAPRYFVRTPSFWFPIEARSRAPLFHLLPGPLRVWLIMRHKLGYWEKAGNVDEATQTAQSAILLNRLQMTSLFPDADIITERAYGFTKSYIAIRRKAVP